MEGDGVENFVGQFPLLHQTCPECAVVDEAKFVFDRNPVGVFFEGSLVHLFQIEHEFRAEGGFTGVVHEAADESEGGVDRITAGFGE